MKQFIFCIMLLSFFMVGCANVLVYRSDFDDQQISYYNARLEYEQEIQKVSVEKLQQRVQKLLELCYVLSKRSLSRQKEYAVREVNLKLVRLNKAVVTLEEMRKKFCNGFKLIFTREDWVVSPLQLQCDLEIHYMSGFIDELNESRARVAYLDRYRKECLLMGDVPEEKLEGIDNDLYRMEKDLTELIYKQIPEYLRNVGIVVTRDDQFNFAFPKPGEPKREADKEAEEGMKAACNPKFFDDVSDYEYEFASERYEFDRAFQDLKASIDRFEQAIEAFQEHSLKTKASSSFEPQLAKQAQQITMIMEKSAERIKNLFDEAANDLQQLVGLDVEVVEKELWAKIKTESDEQAQKTNFRTYHDNVLELNTVFEKMFSVTNPQSDAMLLRDRLLTLGKGIQEKKGIWGPGYAYLSPEWQQKIAIDPLDNTLNGKLKELESFVTQAVRPLWKTCVVRIVKEGGEPGYKVNAAGFLEKDEK